MVEFNGKIVLRNDTTANWTANKNTVLLKGETGFEFHEDGSVTMKVGDGVKTWGQLEPFAPGSASKTNFYEAELQEGESDMQALTRVVGENELVKGDIGVVICSNGSYLIKIGDGTNKWGALKYANAVSIVKWVD